MQKQIIYRSVGIIEGTYFPKDKKFIETNYTTSSPIRIYYDQKLIHWLNKQENPVTGIYLSWVKSLKKKNTLRFLSKLDSHPIWLKSLGQYTNPFLITGKLIDLDYQQETMTVKVYRNRPSYMKKTQRRHSSKKTFHEFPSKVQICLTKNYKIYPNHFYSFFCFYDYGRLYCYRYNDPIDII